MLGCQPLLRVVKRGGLLRGVTKGFDRADRLALIRVNRRVLQCVDPVSNEDCRVLLRAGFGGCDDRATGLLQSLHSAAAGAGGVNDQLTA
jgi:hypothetical protein